MATTAERSSVVELDNPNRSRRPCVYGLHSLLARHIPLSSTEWAHGIEHRSPHPPQVFELVYGRLRYPKA